MARYFLEVAYLGTDFLGFQIQDEGQTVQGELNKALQVLFKCPIETTTSSRTDAGVHAAQNFFHWDFDGPLPKTFVYNINAILPEGIALTNCYCVPNEAHSRFDAVARRYRYSIHAFKDPFLQHRSYYFPFPLQEDLLHATATIIKQHTDFTSFSKKNTDVKTFLCTIHEAEWYREQHTWQFTVKANRFLRGMVKALVGTQLQVARGKISLDQFEQIIVAKNPQGADFSPPSEGLFLEQVYYPEHLLQNPIPRR